MKAPVIGLVCFTVFITIVGAQEVANSNSINKLSKPVFAKYRSSVQKKKSDLFPKSIKKFVITEQPLNKRKFERIFERSPLPKLIIHDNRIETTTYFYRIPSRRPLMKPKTFTIALSATTSANDIDSNDSGPLEADKTEKDSLKGKENEYKDNISVETNTEITSKENFELLSEQNDFTAEFSPTESAKMDNNRSKRDRNYNNEGITKHYTDEEKDDLSEFIIVNYITNNNKQKNNMETKENKLVDIDVKKRSVNIIEEENLGTTISGLKYTGRNSLINSRISFNNINT